MNVDMALAYSSFVPERHRVFEKRQRGEPGPWTDDPILRGKKFTNVFRVLDHGSQFLLTELLNTAESPADALARAFLYRMTNRPEIWEWMRDNESVPGAEDMTEDLADLWCGLRDEGMQIFSGAYVIMPEPGVLGVDKTRSVVKLATRYFHPDSPESIVIPFYQSTTMAERFKVLRAQKGIGDFLAMQILTDVGYSEWGDDQNENEFVMPGPGCRNGALEIFPEKRAIDVIHWCRDLVLDMDDCPEINDRPPSLMDIQNTLCEFSKYARYMRKGAPKKIYVGQHKEPQDIVLPAHWSR